jgi:hypothetical protein
MRESLIPKFGRSGGENKYLPQDHDIDLSEELVPLRDQTLFELQEREFHMAVTRAFLDVLESIQFDDQESDANFFHSLYSVLISLLPITRCVNY